MYSTNAAGLKAKTTSLKFAMSELNASIITIQETHFTKKGLFKIYGFETVEAIRKKDKGGSLISINKSLTPILIT